MAASERERSQNRRTALVLLSVAVAFFIGVIADYWIGRG